MSGCFVNAFVKAELPKSILLNVLAERKLVADGNGESAVILDDFSKVECESVVRVDLLANKSSLFKVTVENLPHVILGDSGRLGLDHGLITSKIYIFRFTHFKQCRLICQD